VSILVSLAHTPQLRMTMSAECVSLGVYWLPSKLSGRNQVKISSYKTKLFKISKIDYRIVEVYKGTNGRN